MRQVLAFALVLMSVFAILGFASQPALAQTPTMVLPGISDPSNQAPIGADPTMNEVAEANFFSSPSRWVAVRLAEVCMEMLRVVLDVINNTPEADIGADFFQEQYQKVVRFGTLTTIPIALVATISALLRGGLPQVLRVYLYGLPVAILGSSVVITIIGIMQAINKSLVSAVSGNLVENMDGFYAALSQQAAVDPGSCVLGTTVGDCNGALGIVLINIVVMFFMLIGTVFIWLELLFRNVVIYLSVLFLPLGFAAFVWSPLRRWLFHGFEIVVMTIFGQAVAVIVLAFGFAAFNAGLGSAVPEPGGAVNVGTLLTGTILLFVAATAAPALVVFALAPRHDPTEAGRRAVGSATPLAASSGAQGAVIGAARGVGGLASRGGGGGG